jgi:hypothetical protein
MHLVMAGVTAPSHVYPSLALIAELVSRGHRVSYVVGERLAEVVAATGAEVVAHPSCLPDNNGRWPDDVGEAMQVFLDESIAVLGPMLDGVERPDAVLYDIGGLAGRVAAERWGVPAVQLSLTYVAWEGYKRDTAEQTAALKASPSGKRVYATLRAWLSDNDVQLDADAFLGRPDGCVVLIPRMLQWRKRRWRCRTEVCPQQTFTEQSSASASPRRRVAVASVSWAVQERFCSNSMVTSAVFWATPDVSSLLRCSSGGSSTRLPDDCADVCVELGESVRSLLSYRVKVLVSRNSTVFT